MFENSTPTSHWLPKVYKMIGGHSASGKTSDANRHNFVNVADETTSESGVSQTAQHIPSGVDVNTFYLNSSQLFEKNIEQSNIKNEKNICETKDTKCTTSDVFPTSNDEVDNIQGCFNRNEVFKFDYQLNLQQAKSIKDTNTYTVIDGYISGMSSIISSPSASTTSSPLSSPSKGLSLSQLHQNQHCISKPPHISQYTNGSASAQHYRISSKNSNHTIPSTAEETSKSKKIDLRLAPSPYRQLLPIALCILSFATVFSILIVYMDTTEIRHQQFRLNMSRDYDFYTVAQDDPTLIAFLREIHMRKYPMHFLKNSGSVEQHNLNFSANHDDELTPKMANYISGLVGGKKNGAVIQSLTGSLGQFMTAPWLSETLNWAGIIIEPEPRRFFTLRKQNALRPGIQVVHACVSPNSYPKEVTVHNEESEVRINSLFDEETSWFNSRVKCFPLYTIMLACNRIEYDLLSLGVHGHELQILQTLPFDKIKIEIISIHLYDDEDNHANIETISDFLTKKYYKLIRKFGQNYFYKRNKINSKTRKKDMIMLKTP